MPERVQHALVGLAAFLGLSGVSRTGESASGPPGSRRQRRSDTAAHNRGRRAGVRQLRAGHGAAIRRRRRVGVWRERFSRRRLSRGPVTPAGARFLESVGRSLRLFGRAAGALGDVPELLGVLLETAGAAAAVDKLFGIALQTFEIHETSRGAGRSTLARRGFPDLNGPTRRIAVVGAAGTALRELPGAALRRGLR